MRGILFAVIAYFMFSVMQAGAKILSEKHHVLEIAFYRNLLPFIPIIAYIAVRNKWSLLKTSKPKMMLFRAVFGTLGLIITFVTFDYLPMAEATVILFTSIILTPAVAFFALGERIGIHRWSAIMIGLLGVILMVRPSVDVPLTGVFVAFFTAAVWSIINTTLRYLKTESSITVLFYFILGGVIIPGLAMPFVARALEWHELPVFLLVGISGGLGQYFLTSAFRMAPTSLVSMFNYTGLLWATLFDIAIWNHIPTINVFIGGGIILAANLYIVHRERMAEQKKLLQL